MKIENTADGSIWFCCPFCGRKLFKVMQRTKCRDFQAWCRKCKRETIVNIDGKAIFAADAPCAPQAGAS